MPAKSKRALTLEKKINADNILWQSRLSHNIKSLRALRNISQQQLSEMTGISRVTLSDMENGLTNPKQSYLVALANALEINFTSLYLPQPDRQRYSTIGRTHSQYKVGYTRRKALQAKRARLNAQKYRTVTPPQRRSLPPGVPTTSYDIIA